MTDGHAPNTSPASAAQCPHCHKPVPDETLKCPHCQEWIIDRPSNETGRSPWFWPIVIAIGAVAIVVVLAIRSAAR